MYNDAVNIVCCVLTFAEIWIYWSRIFICFEWFGAVIFFHYFVYNNFVMSSRYFYIVNVPNFCSEKYSTDYVLSCYKWNTNLVYTCVVYV